jgi:hypothetical protein
MFGIRKASSQEWLNRPWLGRSAESPPPKPFDHAGLVDQLPVEQPF